MPSTLRRTTSGSGLLIGYFQWSMFMTEWISRPVSSDARATVSASARSVMVCISMPSKPTAFASAKRSFQESDDGSIETSTARFTPAVAGPGFTPSVVGPSFSSGITAHAANGAPATLLRMSRRVRVPMPRIIA